MEGSFFIHVPHWKIADQNNSNESSILTSSVSFQVYLRQYFSTPAVHFCHLVYSNREEEKNFKDQSWRPIPKETGYLA